ncbi:alkaline phosphatase [Rhodococcus erythropolis]|jgi:alkaline phosphatase|uniref:Alkaline phosphatase n=1 Tax=Rhodococcus baikonurensis TaxID=172041 RepID=A0ABV5XB27_9NOCA|nr:MULTISPECIES: alkaline phosphatase [unclassified Rhodococcus (in: high G+C Gram-positive bacteria)]NHP15471.1 alkaline phosphatase [Rhodococcus sp. IC4_135]MDI9957992.1 alkaline phosphatase [Rhodococcus sp. IEGM 1237]MDI9963447.1 alkaline phosphatase [Rhodococcus sp. IEGM 1251]MDV8126248.1 alkaline phosphatase [Rhodococcus sp. IEGM 1304]QQM22688.1 alkaline phosphatase [Rhodococcus sp. P-2]
MSFSRNTRRLTAVAGAVAVLAAAGCSSSADEATGSNGATVDRAATGELSSNGGARRIDGDQSAAVRDAVNASGAKNVILLIGDGMGDSEITAARNYAEGAAGSFPGLDALPITGQYTHYALTKDGKPDYVTDSAASGSAWSTGTKTYNGAISVDIKGQAQSTVLEIAKANGKATGNVSTAEVQDATPAVQVAHVSGRKCYGPEATSKSCPENAIENGGKGSISEQLLDTRADVTFAGGAKSFAETAKAGDWQGKTLNEQAAARGYQLVKNAAEMNEVGKADQDAPVLGLFADGNMPVRWEGSVATRDGYLQPAETCVDNPKRTSDVPKLADMTQKAIDLLKVNDNGFFLQVEGASIDKQDHAANACGQIGETVDLDEAVQKALEFAKTDGETLVIVTADHAHTSQIVTNVSADDIATIAKDQNIPVERAQEIVYPGLTRKLTTKDGSEMTISYGTSEDPAVESEGHTGTQLRVAAFGPHAANVSGLTDQTDLFFTMTDALGLDRSKVAAH